MAEPHTIGSPSCSLVSCSSVAHPVRTLRHARIHSSFSSAAISHSRLLRSHGGCRLLSSWQGSSALCLATCRCGGLSQA
eukprot:13085717-Alexandrium_andersonii.AAC.1